MTDDELRALIAACEDPDSAHTFLRMPSIAEIARDALRFRHVVAQSKSYFDGFQLHMDNENLGIREAIDADMGEATVKTPKPATPTLNMDDVQIDYFRANPFDLRTPETSVRLTHRPTGRVASCTKYKSMHRNRVTAMERMAEAIAAETEKKPNADPR